VYLGRYNIKTAGSFRILLSEDSLRVTELMEHMFLKCIVAVNTLLPGGTNSRTRNVNEWNRVIVAVSSII